MSFYISVFYNYEILGIRGEFLVDDYGQVYFVYASDIRVRPKFGYEEIMNKYDVMVCRKRREDLEEIDPELAEKIE